MKIHLLYISDDWQGGGNVVAALTDKGKALALARRCNLSEMANIHATVDTSDDDLDDIICCVVSIEVDSYDKLLAEIERDEVRLEERRQKEGLRE